MLLDAAILFENDARNLVLNPLEIMIEIVENVAKAPKCKKCRKFTNWSKSKIKMKNNNQRKKIITKKKKIMKFQLLKQL